MTERLLTDIDSEQEDPVMTHVFENVLIASFHGSIIIAVVLLLRLLLGKAPRKFICLLWLMAGLRLLVPLEISSTVSLQPKPYTGEASYGSQVADWTPEFMLSVEPEQEPQMQISNGPPEQTQTTYVQPESQPTAQPRAEFHWMEAAALVWLLVMGAIGVCCLMSYLRLRRRVREAIRVKEGIWVCDRINTAFILGYVRPRIYIPMGISREVCKHILAHERTHLEKGDHWYKLMGFVALTVHWFNPLVWIGYVLLCKDIEMACDERVVQFMELGERKRYSAALLACSSGRTHLSTCPVAFGEVSVKERIRRVLNYKKPSFWISLTAVAALAFVAVCFLTSPQEAPEAVPETTEMTTQEETAAQVVVGPEHDLSDLPEVIPQEEYVDPNGHDLRLYVYSEKPTGARLGLSMYSDMDYDTRSKIGRGITFTEAYWMEQQVEGQWKKLEPKTPPAFNDLRYNLSEQQFHTIVDWSTLYGELYDGHFRLGKNLEIDGQTYTYYAEFYIMDNDPVKEPEVKQVVDRIHAALDEIESRECVHVVTMYDRVSEAEGEVSGQLDMMWSGDDYIQIAMDEGKHGIGNGQTARFHGVSYVGGKNQWYNAGELDFSFYGGGDWVYGQKLNGYHVTLNGSSKDALLQEKVSVILDSRSSIGASRAYRDYYFDGQGKLIQVGTTTYTRSGESLYKNHTTVEIYPEERSTLVTKLEAVAANGENHTYEEYEQLMREQEFDKDFSLGAGSFMWRQRDWVYRIGGVEGSATATGIMVNHEYGSGDSLGSLYTQGGFWIEAFVDGKWSRVAVPAGKPQPSAEAKLIFDNTNGLTNPTRMRCDWSESYGTLEPGFYRVAQNYKLTAGGQENIKTCYAKFRVYDPNMEEYLAQVRQGLADILARETYIVETMKDYYGFKNGDAGKVHDVRLENIWKKDHQNFYSSYQSVNHGDQISHSLLLDGKGYFHSGEPGDGWEYVDHFDRETFEFWQISGFTMSDPCISTVEKDGNVITVNHDVTEYKQRFVFTFDDAGRLVEGQGYNTVEEEPVLTDEFKVLDTTKEAMEVFFAKQDITKPAAFSYAEDEKLFPNYDNWKTSGFQNTTPVVITTAQEAQERAKNDCALPVQEGGDGGWNLIKPFFDESTQIWKVEFTYSQGGVFQAVYMTADGITICVVS